MAAFKEIGISFRSGISLGMDAGIVIAQEGRKPDIDFPESLIMEWSAPVGWTSFKIPLTAIRMCQLPGTDPELVVMGAGGYVHVVSQRRIVEEMIDLTNEGPRLRGNIRDMRLIGDHIYAAGMNRQVYRRIAPGKWVHCDRGVVQPLGTLEITGFCAIDGLSESEFWAVGFNGEIWYCAGQTWYRIDSPTNLILHRVRVIDDDLIYASGQEGVLLKGSRNGWQHIEHTITNENLWGMEWFNDRLYIAGDHAIYCYDGNQLAVVDTGLGDNYTYRHLNAFNGGMWSFGTHHIARTDGKNWYDVTPRE
jgi:hypothetical protein